MSKAQLLAELARLERRLESKEALEREPQATHTLLTDAIESLPVAFALFDSDDRLVMFNSNFPKFTPTNADLVKVGVPFEALVRAGIERGHSIYPEESVEAKVAARLQRHRESSEPFERRRTDGSWLLVSERRTHNGGVILVETDITEQKEQQFKLSESEAAFRRLLENAKSGVLVHSNGRPLFCNEAFALLHGHDRPEDVMALPTIDCHVAPSELPRVREYRARRAAGQPSPRQYEFQAMGKDGKAFWLETEVQTVTWHGEQATLAIMRDVSERREAQEALRASRESLADAQRIAHVGNWERDIAGNAVSWSDEIFRILGYQPKQFADDHTIFLERVHKDDRDVVRRSLENALAGAKPFAIEHRIVRPDGKIRIVHQRGEVVRSDDDTPPKIIGTVQDITERRLIEEELTRLNAELEQRIAERTRELRNERDRAERYLDIANTMFLALDTAGTVTLVNRKLCEVLGYSEAELLGKDWYETCVPKESATARKASYLRRISAGSRDFVPNEGTGLRVLAKNGKVHTVSWRESAILGDNGALIGVLGAAEDVTDQRLTEIELRRAQRSEALANLAGGIAHSLNNLITPIVALSDNLMHRMPADSEHQPRIAKIFEAGMRAADLVNRILVFSRREDPQPVVCDIGVLLGDTIDLLRQTVVSTIRIDLEVPSASEPVFADPVQIETVIMNLVTNAAAAIGNKTGNIRVTLERRQVEMASADLEPANYACITVSDDGPGIAAETLESIFNPFFTTKEVGKGTGLGLSIAEGVIRRHGGAIRVQSEPGGGARFEVYLPLHAESVSVSVPPVGARA